MKVSIITVTYNHEKFIAQAIEGSLMQETNFDYEILIGEDDSSDNTREICKQYAEKHPDKIRLFLNDRKNVIYINGQPTGRWNFINLLKNAKGKYIALCDGDDYWTDPHKLQKQVDFLEANPDFVICHHNMKIIYENSKKQSSLSNINQKSISTMDDLLNGNFISAASCCFRNRLIKKIPSWHKNVMPGDWPLYILLTQYGKIKYLNEIMGVYRNHTNGIWSPKPKEYHLLCTIKMYNKINKHLNFKYNNLIKLRLLNYNSSLAKIYWKNGNKKISIKLYFKSFFINPFIFLKKIFLKSIRNTIKNILKKINLFNITKKFYSKISYQKNKQKIW